MTDTMIPPARPKRKGGFGSMNPDRVREIASMGGKAQKSRAFDRDPELASRAGKLGGIASAKARAAKKAAKTNG